MTKRLAERLTPKQAEKVKKVEHLYKCVADYDIRIYSLKTTATAYGVSVDTYTKKTDFISVVNDLLRNA